MAKTKSSGSERRQFVVAQREAGVPLVAFLASRLGCSKKRAKQLLDEKHVRINAARVWMARHEVRPGDRIDVVFQRVSSRQQVPRILFQDDGLLGVDKPAGLLSNGGKVSAESLLRAELKCSSISAVHRLDRDTSGCLLFAMNEQARLDAIQLFRARAVTKEYQAIVSGCFQHEHWTEERAIDGRPAATRLRRIRSGKYASHLRAGIATGRTHQIRRHLMGLGHPVLGDHRYGRDPVVRGKPVAVPRQMLHASLLAFKHPNTGERVQMVCSPPPDYLRCLERFGLRSCGGR
jgi:23S rRNA pseudouridine1911/1915/1917 synthase